MKKKITDDAVPGADIPSRTQKKKAAEALQKAGEQLLALNDTQLENLQLPLELHEAVVAARHMKAHGARRRQMQYIGSLMRQIDAPQVLIDLESAKLQASRDARAFKRAEQWRDEIASGDQNRLNALTTEFPEMDRDQLLQLAENVRNSTAIADRRRAGRALYRFLRRFADGSIV